MVAFVKTPSPSRIRDRTKNLRRWCPWCKWFLLKPEESHCPRCGNPKSNKHFPVDIWTEDLEDYNPTEDDL